MDRQTLRAWDGVGNEITGLRLQLRSAATLVELQERVATGHIALAGCERFRQALGYAIDALSTITMGVADDR